MGLSFCSLCLIVHIFFPSFYTSKSLASRVVAIAPYFTSYNFCKNSKIYFTEDFLFSGVNHSTAETSSGLKYKIFSIPEAQQLEEENRQIFLEVYALGRFVSVDLVQQRQFLYGNAVLTIQVAMNPTEWSQIQIVDKFQDCVTKFNTGQEKTENDIKGFIHSLQLFGVSVRTQAGSKDPETKKALKGYSRVLPPLFNVADEASALTTAVADHVLLVFLYLKDVSNCRDAVKNEFEKICGLREVPE